MARLDNKDMADLDLDAKRVSLLDVIHKSKSEIVTTRLTWVASLTEVLTPAKAAKLAGALPRCSALCRRRVHGRGRVALLAAIVHFMKVRTSTALPRARLRLAERYQELLQAANGTAQGASDEPTGLLLLFPCCAAAQLEARPDATNEALRALQACASELSLGTIRVISLTDDLPARAHHSSASAFGGGEARAHADPAEEGAAVSVASDINLKFIAFGQQLQCAPHTARTSPRSWATCIHA